MAKYSLIVIMDKSNTGILYLGKSGHLLVMSEFLFRGWNAAIPEVDVGDDIFVVRDSEGTLYRIQVKTGIGKHENDEHYSCKFSLNRDQLLSPQEPELTYAFVVRFEHRWGPILLIPRDDLFDLFQDNSKAKAKKISITVYYRDRITLWKQDISNHESKWDDIFPIIDHS